MEQVEAARGEVRSEFDVFLSHSLLSLPSARISGQYPRASERASKRAASSHARCQTSAGTPLRAHWHHAAIISEHPTSEVEHSIAAKAQIESECCLKGTGVVIDLLIYFMHKSTVVQSKCPRCSRSCCCLRRRCPTRRPSTDRHSNLRFRYSSREDELSLAGRSL